MNAARARALLGTSPSDQVSLLPRPSDVLYSQPNPDGSRKACSNCALWGSGTGGRCAIHAPSFLARAVGVCGYHVPGKPMAMRVQLPGLAPCDPKLSGYVEVDGGTSCDVCRHYKAGVSGATGHCRAVVNNKGAPSTVWALGCCARWEGKQ